MIRIQGRWSAWLAAPVVAGVMALAPVEAQEQREYDLDAIKAKVEEEEVARAVRRTCNACHGAGAGFMGAPTIGNRDNWEWRLDSRGFERMAFNTVRGFGAMPPKGGTNLTEEQVAAAVLRMVLESGITMDEVRDWK